MPRRSLLPFAVLLGGFVWFGLCSWLKRYFPQDAPEQPDAINQQKLLLFGLAGLVLAMLAAALVAMQLWS